LSEFLLELLSEDIPALMQTAAARSLERLAREGLSAEGLQPSSLTAHAGPRRLTLFVEGLASRQPDRTEERRGPRANAPAAAIEGFLRAVRVSQDDLEARDGVLFAVLQRPGRATPEVLEDLTKAIVARFPWPKSMISASGSTRWVRPLRRILAVFDGEVVPVVIDAVSAGPFTEGHRVMGPKTPIRVSDGAAYREALAQAFVVLSADERRRRIVEEARALCDGVGLHWVEDFGLLEEVAGMVEWPVAILGDMDPTFLRLPPEVVRTSMRVHQRYFAVRVAPDGPLSPHFVCIANIVADDGGELIARGNARVLSARLDDARFFYEEDCRLTLEERLPRLAGVTFHAQLGTLLDRAMRIEIAARHIAPLVGADAGAAALAGRLCKSDLTSAMVGEFPELQGVMGGYYAAHEGLPRDVAVAISEHYRPQGPSDAIPLEPTAIAVALADKVDTLIGFFSIGEAPTGSRDPFALRRSALGVIRIIIESRLRLRLGVLIDNLAEGAGLDAPGLMAFIIERLKVTLRESGRRHDLIEAALGLGDDDLIRVIDRIDALGTFLGSEIGANLLQGFRRASNILAAEARKPGGLPPMSPTRAPAPGAEADLYEALMETGPLVRAALEGEDFAAAMAALATLRAPVDVFFDEVLVNSGVPEERNNRLALLAGVRELMLGVADFSRVNG
jgi:glycyl-tRNA synthetase beta chain